MRRGHAALERRRMLNASVTAYPFGDVTEGLKLPHRRERLLEERHRAKAPVLGGEEQPGRLLVGVVSCVATGQRSTSMTSDGTVMRRRSLVFVVFMNSSPSVTGTARAAATPCACSLPCEAGISTMSHPRACTLAASSGRSRTSSQASLRHFKQWRGQRGRRTRTSLPFDAPPGCVAAQRQSEEA
jgi:hypothetical protein